MKHRRLFSGFFLAAALVTAALIFWFSAQKGAASQLQSDGISLRLARLSPRFAGMSEAARQGVLEALSVAVRKGAHFGEFALLSLNLALHLRLRGRALPARRAVQVAWGLGTLYAVSDELHQLFVSERAARLLDVIIDSLGALAGALLACWLLARILQRMGK